MRSTGLEITDQYLRAVVVVNTGKIRVEKYLEQKLPEGTITGGKLINAQIFQKVASDILRRIRATRYIVVSLPSSPLFVKTQSVPLLTSEDIAGLISTNIAQYLPFKPDDAYYDWQVLPPSTIIKGNNEVLILAVQKKVADDYLNVLLQIHFVPLAFENWSIGLERLLPKIESPYLVVKGEGVNLDGAIYQNGLRFVKGFSNLIKSVDISKAINNLADFYETEAQTEIKQCYFLNLSSQLGTLGKRFETQNLENDLVKNLPDKFWPALGSALRGLIDPKEDKNLSLLPLGSRQSYEIKKVAHFTRNIVNIFLFFGIIYLLAFGAVYFYFTQLISQSDSVLQTLSLKPLPIVSMGDLEDKAKLFNERITLWQTIQKESMNPTSYITQIEKKLSAGINLTKIGWPTPSEPITVGGFADNREALLSFKDNLTNSNFWQKIELPPSALGLSENINFIFNLYPKK